jgi:hypothetical protein
LLLDGGEFRANKYSIPGEGTSQLNSHWFERQPVTAFAGSIATRDFMTQSTHDRAAELHNLAAHAHLAAAAAHSKAGHLDHLTAHELSKQAHELSMNAHRHTQENFKVSQDFARV